MSDSIKIVLIDDHKVVRKGLKMLLNVEEDFDVVQDFGSAKEALEYLADHPADIVVVDITMPDMNGIDFARQVQRNGWKLNLLMLTMHLDREFILDALDAGATGYVVKESSEDDIAEAVRTVVKGEHFFSGDVSEVLTKSLLGRKKQQEVEKKFDLTSREKEVLKCIVNGLSNKMIGPELNISERTVNVHRYNVMKKLEANNTADVVRIALQNELI